MAAYPTNPLELRYQHEHPLRTLWNLIYGDRAKFITAIVFFLIKHSPVWLAPIVTAKIINVIEAQRHWGYAVAWGGLQLTMVIINLPANTIHVKLLAGVIRHAETKLRRALVQRLQQLSMGVHDDMHSGTMHSKVLRDVEAIQQLSHQLINTVLSGLALIIIALVTTLSHEPRVTLLFIVNVPVSVALMRVFRRKMRKENRQLRGEIEEMSSRVSEMMDMLPVTRAHGAEDVEVERVGNQIEKVKESGIRVDVLNAVFGACMWVVLQVSQLTCLAFTGYLAYNGKIRLGDVVMYQGFFQMLLQAVNHMLGILPRITAGFESIRSLGEVLECPDLEENEGKKQVAHVDGGFEFQDVSFEYPNANERSVVDFNLNVRPGECVALVGESGAGKSTIINLIIGFRRPTHGRILLDGLDMEALDLRTYRRHIAVVPQETILFSGSVRENITYGMEDVSDEAILRAVDIANLRDVVESLPEKLETVIGESGCKLSGGQRQRLAIARAIIRDPRVILLDEATSSLDVVSEAAVQKAINQAIQGRTTFIVAHRLSTIRQADRIVVMKNGRCIERGTHDELIEAGGEFATLKSLQT